jgi:hydrogenase maturation protease
VVPAVADLGKHMLCVIGCGNSTRSDDGVGVYIAQTLRAQLLRNPQPNVQVFDAGTGGMDVMFQARGASRLIIVDASKSGSEAGAIFKVPGRELASEPDASFSLHDFRWQHALTAGRKIFGADFPSEVTIFLIEAANLGYGLELSAPVLLSADRVVEEIRETILGSKNPGALSAYASLSGAAS